ncbi:ABC-F family ATP-binding cassette domain-containing protein [Candidatus Gracilibacteria bacterium 28_42_T64]|nr:ABC-F family ATP-binding cassette domain-containing protein [Candidatus Gracilibacteria bacterium 28_42_T64]
MLENIINRVLEHHDDFTYEEVKEICDDFLAEIPKKIKPETKLKRLNKFLDKEFELEGNDMKTQGAVKNYSLETIPKYLFEGKSKIVSSLINIKTLNKNIEQTYLFENASLKVNSNDKIALIGKNGCGKTTLLKMIIGKEENLDGIIEIAPGLNIGYLSQDLFWKSEKNTLKEEMLELFPEINKQIARLNEIQNDSEAWEEVESLNKSLIEEDGFKKYLLQLDILKYFGFSDEQLDFNVLQLSGGEQTKVQIAKFLIQEVDLLILDEPTNHLDINGIIFLEQFCKNWKKAILSISHDIRFINNTSTKIAEISNKSIHNYPGNYEEYLIEKQSRFDKEMKDYTNQKREIDRQNDYINRFRANSAKASSVQSRIKALDKVDVLTKPENESIIKMIQVNSDKRLPEVIMKLHNVEVGYDYPIVTLPKYIEVYKSDKIGIIGENGAGKTTLLKTILGELSALDGTSEINETIKIGSYSQVLEDLDINSSIIEELGKDYESEKEIRTILGGLLIQGDKVDQKISTLSGGEKAKVALTKMLLVKPHIIVMDEPTNHLDLHSKEVIKKMLEGFNGTTLIVSHDRDLLESVSNKIWLIKEKMLVVYNEPEKGFSEIF